MIKQLSSTLIISLFLAVVLFPMLTLSQEAEGCDGARYRYLVFEDFDKIEDVVYGSNIAANGSEVNLEMDIYLPQGDSLTNRPVLVCAHGGFFMVGNNESPDIVPICEDFARMGYVAVSISYRLGVDNWLSLQTSMQEAVLRGVHDGKAAVRFLRKSHEEDGNPWGIDPDRIMMGGSSAGAFIALHAAYIDEDEIPNIINQEDPGLGGGVEGESGNSGYSSEVISVFSMSGAIGDANWIEEGDVPVVSTHGTDDTTVPYGSGSVQFLLIDIDQADGSSTIHEVAEEKGVENCFKTLEGADHIPHQFSAEYYDTTLSVISGFNSMMVCPSYENLCGYYDVTDVPEINNEPDDPIDCPQDIVVNGVVDVSDMMAFLANYGCTGDCVGDFNNTGNVSISDVLSILAIYGSYCE